MNVTSAFVPEQHSSICFNTVHYIRLEFAYNWLSIAPVDSPFSSKVLRLQIKGYEMCRKFDARGELFLQIFLTTNAKKGPYQAKQGPWNGISAAYIWYMLLNNSWKGTNMYCMHNHPKTIKYLGIAMCRWSVESKGKHSSIDYANCQKVPTHPLWKRDNCE